MRSLVVALVVCVAVCKAQSSAIAFLESAGSDIQGTVEFSQDTPLGDVTVTVQISGLAPNSDHGFHIHTFGDLSDISSSPPSTGFHFFPYCPPDNCTSDQHHGFPDSIERHAGDMGNISADASGVVSTTIVIGDGKMSLSDTYRSVVGRAVAVHNNPDTGVQPFGGAGAIIAAGVVGLKSLTPGEAQSSKQSQGVICKLQMLNKASAPDNQEAVGYVEVLWPDPRYDSIVRAKLFETPPSSPYIEIREFGDMSNAPTSLGGIHTSEGIVPITDFTTCNKQGLHFSHTDQTEFTGLIGRSCVLRSGGASGDVIAVGVIGIPNPEDSDNLIFSDYFFRNEGKRCQAPKSTTTQRNGAIAGGVLGAIALLGGVFLFLAWYNHWNVHIFEPAPPPGPRKSVAPLRDGYDDSVPKDDPSL